MPHLLFDIGILLAAVIILAYLFEGEIPQSKAPQKLLCQAENITGVIGLWMGRSRYDIAVAGGGPAPPGQVAAQLIGDGNLPAADTGRLCGQVELGPFQEADFVAEEAQLPCQPDNEHIKAGGIAVDHLHHPVIGRDGGGGRMGVMGPALLGGAERRYGIHEPPLRGVPEDLIQDVDVGLEKRGAPAAPERGLIVPDPAGVESAQVGQTENREKVLLQMCFVRLLQGVGGGLWQTLQPVGRHIL